MIGETVLTEIVKILFSRSEKFFKGDNFKLGTSIKDIESGLSKHLRLVKNWSSEIQFKDLKQAKKTQSVYIELDMFVYPRKVRMDEKEEIGIINILDLFKQERNHVVILGQPGAGKTTSMKFVCQSIFFNEEFYPDDFHFPILIKLRDFNKPLPTKSSKIIVDYIFDLFSLKIDSSSEKDFKYNYAKKEALVIDLLNNLKVLLIIEGFDELVFKKHKEIVLEELSSLATQVESSRIIMTSRTADYSYSFEKISLFELCPLDENQIFQFASKWLENGEVAKRFVAAVKNSPFSDTTIRPLTIAHLCAIFERVGKIPDKPKTVYKKIVNLLLEEWDEQRNVKRESTYAKFEIDRKFEFLTGMAYILTIKSRKSVFSIWDLENAYQKIYEDFDLIEKEVEQVINELESHTGLFVQAGFGIYEFAHKSLQEYLTAEYIVRLPYIPEQKVLIERLPNEFAIAVTISSNPSAFFSAFVFTRLSDLSLPMRFYQTFINRLLLEKPDFNKNSIVGAAALYLYSLYINNSTDDSSQLQMFTMDKLVNEFETFIGEIFRRNSIDIILEYYNRVSSTLSENGDIIISFELKKAGTLIKQDTEYQLPYFLSCRETFIKANSKKFK